MARRNSAALATDSAVNKGRKKDALQRKPSSRTPAQAQDARRKWADRIRVTWARNIAATIETGKLLIAAKRGLPPGEFMNMVHNDLPFHHSTYDRLMVIARHPVLSQFAHAQSLPASWYTLFVLSRIPAKRMVALIEDGSITPRMQRHEAEKLIDRENAKLVNLQPKPVPAVNRVIPLHISTSSPPHVMRPPPPRLDDSAPSDEVPEALKQIAAQVKGEPEAIDRLAILLAAWNAADESERHEFLRHIGARFTDGNDRLN